MKATLTQERSITPGSIALALANIVPLIGVLLGYWNAFDIIFLYWFENIIIGLFTVCRMTIRPDTPAFFKFGGLFLGAFFCVHYGFFTYGHGSFIASFFDEQLLGTDSGINSNILNVAGYMLSQRGIQITIAAMFLAHIVEYIIAYRHRDIETAPKEMFKPYKRIIVLHIAIIFGGFIATMLDNSIGVALVMIALKTYFDLKPPQFATSANKSFDKSISDEEAREKIRQSLLNPEIKINGKTHQFSSVEEMVNSEVYKKHSKWIRWLLPKKHRALYEEVLNECLEKEQQSTLSIEPKDIKPPSSL
ncbi:DUF6498-containing protein [Kangiella geojedonensis]|uniref:Uncharacterized protein n=1 Tax=Kangiella geojedonensis TaxID=914150 RepID=A0A0F6TR81_9GAMM|nr:DUF6498-containing protein [Kangiella geojedonensis]AKE52457.1 hypothetical protein TQ33_1510 [Kangiella geojedonensis]